MAESDVAAGGRKASLPFAVKFQVTLALLATALTVGLAAYLPTLINRRSQLERDIAQLQKQKDTLVRQTKQLTEQRDAYHSIANNVAAELPPEQAQKVIEKTFDSNPEAAKVLPRIFIHIRSAAQRPKATEIAKALRSQGYIVPGVQILVNEGPDENQVRYFHDSDSEKKEANEIAVALTSAGIAAPQIKYVSNYPNIRGRQYEVWFTASAL